MNNLHVYDDKTALAEAIAQKTIDILSQVINERSSAVWVLAGGSTPLLAYDIIAQKYANALDWSRVTVVLGDERMGPLDDFNNNWHAIFQILNKLPFKKIRPDSTLTAEESAEQYAHELQKLPKKHDGVPRLDVMWLGIGPDGHTLSLFPNHNSIIPTSKLVIPVHDSPKPPPDRISLSLRALLGVESALVIASGNDKRNAIASALSGKRLPITLATDIIATHGHRVDWLVDRLATPMN